ncbi:MAG: acetate kinase, partial [Limnochordia bacterium]
ENSPILRSKICTEMDYLGIAIDEERNYDKDKEKDISTPTASVRVLVIPTDEELMIARETCAKIS